MYELTRVITVQITDIARELDDDTKLMSKEQVEELLREHIDTDDVKVIQLQDFMRELPEKKAGEQE